MRHDLLGRPNRSGFHAFQVVTTIVRQWVMYVVLDPALIAIERWLIGLRCGKIRGMVLDHEPQVHNRRGAYWSSCDCKTNNRSNSSPPMMKTVLNLLCFVIFTSFSGQLFAQQSCPTLSSVKKWEVISGSKLLAYDNNDQYYFFMNIGTLLSRSMPKVGGPVTLRFFSSTICAGDNIIVNGDDTRVHSIEGIRR